MSWVVDLWFRWSVAESSFINDARSMVSRWWAARLRQTAPNAQLLYNLPSLCYLQAGSCVIWQIPSSFWPDWEVPVHGEVSLPGRTLCARAMRGISLHGVL